MAHNSNLCNLVFKGTVNNQQMSNPYFIKIVQYFHNHGPDLDVHISNPVFEQAKCDSVNTPPGHCYDHISAVAKGSSGPPFGEKVQQNRPFYTPNFWLIWYSTKRAYVIMMSQFCQKCVVSHRHLC